MAIYITGDIHGDIDIRKLKNINFITNKPITKEDFVIICGDFGLVWDESDNEKYWIQWLENKNFTTLFVDGNHENFDLLEQYEVKEWNGGKVQYISNSVIHLMRGQMFNINGFKFFTMGGATSIDKCSRVEGKSWWKQEIPSQQEFQEALNNLDNNNWKVDYVISHTTSMKIMSELGYVKEDNSLNRFFDLLEKKLDYKHWYFGHFHDDINLKDKKHTLLYKKIIRIL